MLTYPLLTLLNKAPRETLLIKTRLWLGTKSYTGRQINMYDYATAKVYLSYKRTSLLRRSHNYDGGKVLGLWEMCVHAVSTEKYELV